MGEHMPDCEVVTRGPTGRNMPTLCTCAVAVTESTDADVDLREWEDDRSVRGAIDSAWWLLNNAHNHDTDDWPGLLDAARADRDRGLAALSRMEANDEIVFHDTDPIDEAGMDSWARAAIRERDSKGGDEWRHIALKLAEKWLASRGGSS